MTNFLMAPIAGLGRGHGAAGGAGGGGGGGGRGDPLHLPNQVIANTPLFSRLPTYVFIRMRPTHFTVHMRSCSDCSSSNNNTCEVPRSHRGVGGGRGRLAQGDAEENPLRTLASGFGWALQPPCVSLSYPLEGWVSASCTTL